MNLPQQRTYQMSTPSPMAQISTDEVMRLEFAQLRAELSLLRAQMGKREAPDVPPSPRAVAPTGLEPQGEDDADLSDVDARQEAEDAAKFYKDEWKRLKIQVNEQNKAIADLKAALLKELGVCLCPIECSIPSPMETQVELGHHILITWFSIFGRDVDEDRACSGSVEIRPLHVNGHHPVRAASLLVAGTNGEDCLVTFQRWRCCE